MTLLSTTVCFKISHRVTILHVQHVADKSLVFLTLHLPAGQLQLQLLALSHRRLKEDQRRARLDPRHRLRAVQFCVLLALRSVESQAWHRSEVGGSGGRGSSSGRKANEDGEAATTKRRTVITRTRLLVPTGVEQDRSNAACGSSI